MAQLFVNNAYSFLDGSILIGDTTINVTTGTGSRFPAPTGGDTFLITAVGLDGNGKEDTWEVMECTGRTGDALTVVRAQEGTSAVAWTSGTAVELRLTAATITALEDIKTSALEAGDIGVTVQGYDATLLNDADIGVTVQNYDSTLLNASDIGVNVQGYDSTLLNAADIGVNVQAYDAGTAKLDVIQTFTAAQTINALTLGGAVTGNDQTVSRINLQDYGEVTNAIGSTGGGTQDIDITLGNVVSATVDTSANTFTFSNPTASDEGCGFILYLTNGGSQTVTWPASVDWPGAAAPTLTATGIDILVFTTIDGGTTWYGNVAGQAYA